MTFRAKSLAAGAAVAAALAVAAPVTSASAATTAPAAHTQTARLAAGSPGCWLLINQQELSQAAGNPLLASLFANAFLYSGCGGAAI